MCRVRAKVCGRAGRGRSGTAGTPRHRSTRLATPMTNAAPGRPKAQGSGATRPTRAHEPPDARARHPLVDRIRGRRRGGALVEHPVGTHRAEVHERGAQPGRADRGGDEADPVGRRTACGKETPDDVRGLVEDPAARHHRHQGEQAHDDQAEPLVEEGVHRLTRRAASGPSAVRGRGTGGARGGLSGDVALPQAEHQADQEHEQGEPLRLGDDGERADQRAGDVEVGRAVRGGLEHEPRQDVLEQVGEPERDDQSGEAQPEPAIDHEQQRRVPGEEEQIGDELLVEPGRERRDVAADRAVPRGQHPLVGGEQVERAVEGGGGIGGGAGGGDQAVDLRHHHEAAGGHGRGQGRPEGRGHPLRRHETSASPAVWSWGTGPGSPETGGQGAAERGQAAGERTGLGMYRGTHRAIRAAPARPRTPTTPAATATEATAVTPAIASGAAAFPKSPVNR